MAGYTVQNLKEVEDQAPKFGMEGIEFRQRCDRRVQTAGRGGSPNAGRLLALWR